MQLPLSWKFLALFSCSFFSYLSLFALAPLIGFFVQQGRRRHVLGYLAGFSAIALGWISRPQPLPQRDWERLPASLWVSPDGGYRNASGTMLSVKVLGGNLRPETRLLWKLPYTHSIEPKVGEIWQVEGFVEWPQKPKRKKAFDAGAWLSYLNIDYFLKASTNRIRCLSEGSGGISPGSAREKLRAKMLESPVNDAPKALMLAMALGDKSLLKTETKNWFARAGLSHVLAVSGLHAGLIFGFVALLLRPIPAHRFGFRLLKCVVLLMALWAYAWLTGFSPSVIRVGIMMSLYALAPLFRQPIQTLHVLGLAALAMLSFDSKYVMHPGFQLSFLAVAGILLWVPKMEKWRPIWCPKWVWSSISVTLSAQLFTSPLALYHFGSFPWLFLVNNAVGIPLGAATLWGANLWLISEASGFSQLISLDQLWTFPANLLLKWVEFSGAPEWVSIQGAQFSERWTIWCYLLLVGVTFAPKGLWEKLGGLFLLGLAALCIQWDANSGKGTFVLEASGQGFQVFEKNGMTGPFVSLKGGREQKPCLVEWNNKKVAIMGKENFSNPSPDVVLWTSALPPDSTFRAKFPKHTVFLLPIYAENCINCIFPAVWGGLEWSVPPNG